ncbi:hypothetical protein [Halomarina oriensis]|uniref:Uncharacterized protein n=1 Tax=Halomarina oriensis TaxID=671145 RepID=A0A6B0GNE7_9EURY|nr:hypothetical protein [Halomarina oriensis]MWG36314.1 hypothetical protein [Halomarina oriensis]
MAFDDTHRELLDLEATVRPFGVRHDGVPVWEQVRFTVFRRVIAARHGWGEPHTRVDRTHELYAARTRLLARNLVHRNPFLSGHHDVLFWGHARRKRLEDGLWWDVYCDPITERLSLDYLHVEAPHLNHHFTPTKTRALRYVDAIEIAGEVGTVVGRALDRPRFDGFGDVEAAIHDRFDHHVPVDDIARRYLASRRTVQPLYRRFLSRVDPELVVVVVSYAGREPFIDACRELDIPVVELQHGIIDEYQYGYSFPDWRTKRAFPDHLLTFGEFWNRRAAFPIPDDRIHAVGYPHLERSVERYADVPRRDQVVFVSTGEVGHVLSKLAVELAARPTCDWSVVYKLHPGEADRWREEYPWLVGSGVDVVDQTGRPLHRLFAESRAQVGVYSTALYEGLRFGVETYLVDFPWMPSSPALVDRGMTVDGVDDLLDRLGTGRTVEDTTPFFARDPLANVQRAFADILS